MQEKEISPPPVYVYHQFAMDGGTDGKTGGRTNGVMVGWTDLLVEMREPAKTYRRK